MKLNNLIKEELIDLYINQKKSLGDIAKLYGWSYMFIYAHEDSTKLFNLLYKNVKNGLFLERKYNRFLEGLKSYGRTT